MPNLIQIFYNIFREKEPTQLELPFTDESTQYLESILKVRGFMLGLSAAPLTTGILALNYISNSGNVCLKIAFTASVIFLLLASFFYLGMYIVMIEAVRTFKYERAKLGKDAKLKTCENLHLHRQKYLNRSLCFVSMGYLFIAFILVGGSWIT